MPAGPGLGMKAVAYLPTFALDYYKLVMEVMVAL